VSRTSATRRRSAAAGALGALLGGALLTLPAGGPGLQAVAVLDGAVPDVAGVTVVRRLPAVHVAVVRGDRAAMVRLAGARGVLGLAPDDGVQLAGHDERLRGGVLAAQELGGAAGRPGAGAGVRVAVVDTGVSDTAALDRASGRLVDGVDTSGGTARGPYEDGYGHGTFMADLVAGGPFAGRVLGVAPAATVVVVKVASADRSTSLSRVVAGLDWIAATATGSTWPTSASPTSGLPRRTARTRSPAPWNGCAMPVSPSSPPPATTRGTSATPAWTPSP